MTEDARDEAITAALEAAGAVITARRALGQRNGRRSRQTAALDAAIDRLDLALNRVDP